jgi:hypothetical protein
MSVISFPYLYQNDSNEKARLNQAITKILNLDINDKNFELVFLKYYELNKCDPEIIKTRIDNVKTIELTLN